MQAKILSLIALLAMGTCVLTAQNHMDVIAAFQGEHHNSGYGYSMVSLDFNHDGYDDLVVCAIFYGYMYPSTPSRGKVYVYYGGPNFSSSTPASVTVQGNYANSVGRRIWAIYKVGDISGDGFDDLCIHVEDHISWNESYEKLLFFYGGTTNFNTPNYVINLSGNIDRFGRVFTIGDMNGDGFDDIGISYEATPPPAHQNILSIIWGGSYEEHPVSIGEYSSSYSYSINGIGDINNDGYTDFTTGFATPPLNSTSNLMRLYYGNSAGNTDNPITFIQTPSGLNRVSKPLGDINNDGFDDFMGYVSNIGMHVWLGGNSIDYATPNFNLEPAWYGNEFTRSLDYGDFNADGFDDVVGANFGEWQFSVWMGRQIPNGTSDWIGWQAYENFGYSLVTGDFNADGFCDIAIAASHEYNPWPSGDFNGYVWVYGGNAELEDTTVANDDPSAPQVPAGLTLRLSPNPVYRSQGFVTAQLSGTKLPESAQGNAEVFNIRGQKVLSAAFQVRAQCASVTLPVTDLPAGVYTCRITVAGSSVTQRFTRLP